MANVQLERLYHLPVMVYWTASELRPCLSQSGKAAAEGRIQIHPLWSQSDFDTGEAVLPSIFPKTFPEAYV